MGKLAFLAALAAATPLGAADGWVEEFETAKAWRSNNKRAPAEFSASDGILTLVDPPGGEVTWGTSIYTTTPELDLAKTPFLVVKLVEVTHRFRVTLINPVTRQKLGNLLSARRPGILVLDVKGALGFRAENEAVALASTRRARRVAFASIT